MVCLVSQSNGSTADLSRNLESNVQLALASAFYDARSPEFSFTENVPEVNISICHYCDGADENCYFEDDDISLICNDEGTICCTDDIHAIYSYNPCFPQNTTCEEIEAEQHDVVLNSIKYPYFIFGLISIIGNFVVVYQKLKSMLTQAKQHKEIKIFVFLVLNLSLADLLMGVYVFSLSTNILIKSNSADHFIDYPFCNAMGVMNFASSQISVTVLVFISSFRCYSVLYPYKRVSLKLAYVLVAVTWIVWSIMAILPIAPNNAFQKFFQYGIRLDQGKEHDLHLAEPDSLIKNLLISTGNSSQYQDILSVSYTAEEVINVLQRFSLVNLEQETAEPLGYYNLQPVCSVNLILSDHQAPSSYYTLFVLLYNIVSFVIIFLCYAVILKSTIEGGNGLKCKCFGRPKSNKVFDSSMRKQSQRSFENKNMFKRVVFVIVTDFLCWVPICLISMIFFIESSASDIQCSSRQHTCTNLTLYHGIQIAIFYVIPINSSINPYVYSFHFWKELFVKIKNFVLNIFK